MQSAEKKLFRYIFLILRKKKAQKTSFNCTFSYIQFLLFNKRSPLHIYLLFVFLFCLLQI